MKKINILLAFMIAMASMMSCTDDMLPAEPETPSAGNDSVRVRVKAFTGDAETRTDLSADFKVLWSEGDRIKMGVYTFDLVEGAGTTTGTFECSTTSTIRDGEYTVYYPTNYSETKWPQQLYYGPDCISRAPMVGTATVKDGVVSPISFKNVGGVLRYTVKGDEGTKIRFIEIASETNNLDVVMNCINDMVLSPQGAVFNLALPPGTYQNAILTFHAADGRTATKKAAQLKVTRNMVSLATIDNLVFKEPDPDYLLMFYGCGSGNLDLHITRNILQILNEGTDGKVKTTFQYKLSNNLQTSYTDFNGVRRFTGDENLFFKRFFRDDDTTMATTIYNMYSGFLSAIESTKIGDKTYNISSPEALADFISWSKEKYPTAKRTILVLSSHGNGWSIVSDGKKDQTRATMIDDSAKKFLSLKMVADGVTAGGKVDLLYTDACQMGVYENIYGYANCSKYLLTTTERTPIKGGNYPALMKALKATADTSDEEFEKAFRNVCDQSVSTSWWGSIKNFYADIALYNLTKLGILTPVLKKVADTLTEKYTSEESVMPTADLPPLGDQFAAYIRSAASNCMYTTRYFYVNMSEIPSSMVPYLKMDGIWPDGSGDFNFSEILLWARYGIGKGAEQAFAEKHDDFIKLQKVIAGYDTYAFSPTDLLRLLDNALTAAGAQNNPFKQLRADLLDALKKVGYIRCTIEDEKPGIDQEYELCSPGVNLFPLGPEAYYHDWNILPLKNIPSHEDALRYYQNLDFDKQVGWSRFLQQLDVVPTVITNPSRKEVR